MFQQGQVEKVFVAKNTPVFPRFSLDGRQSVEDVCVQPSSEFLECRRFSEFFFFHTSVDVVSTLSRFRPLQLFLTLQCPDHEEEPRSGIRCSTDPGESRPLELKFGGRRPRLRHDSFPRAEKVSDHTHRSATHKRARTRAPARTDARARSHAHTARTCFTVCTC